MFEVGTHEGDQQKKKKKYQEEFEKNFNVI